MLKKLGGIALLFVGSILFSLGLIRLAFDGVSGISLYLHVTIGLIIVGFGVFVIKKN